MTISGPARRKKTDEVEIVGSETPLVDSLALKGFITPSMHRAARLFAIDKREKPLRCRAAIQELPTAKQPHITALLVDGESLDAYGKRIMGYKNKNEAETWAIGALKGALASLADHYHRTAGDDEPVDEDDTEE